MDALDFVPLTFHPPDRLLSCPERTHVACLTTNNENDLKLPSAIAR